MGHTHKVAQRAGLRKGQMDDNTMNWIDDRIINSDPLLWGAFIRFMKDLGFDKTFITLYGTKKYRQIVKREFARRKQLASYM